MRLFIPTIGTRLRLTSKWTFQLHHEHRNSQLWEWLGKSDDHNPWAHWGGDQTPIEVSLPKGTVLAVDRIYIRQQASDFDSVTFRLQSIPGGKKGKPRFWAKLADVNKINMVVEDGDGQ